MCHFNMLLWPFTLKKKTFYTLSSFTSSISISHWLIKYFCKKKSVTKCFRGSITPKWGKYKELSRKEWEMGVIFDGFNCFIGFNMSY